MSNSTSVQRSATADLEIHLLLEAVYRTTGCDFRECTPSALRRRIGDRVRAEQVATVSGLQEKALHDLSCMERLIHGLAAAPSTLFRDPGFFRSFRTLVVPLLRTYPFVRIWNAGCSTGEDAYAIAIVLREEGIDDRCKIYATDASDRAIMRAKEGAFSAAMIDDCAPAHADTGGPGTLRNHFAVTDDCAAIASEIKAQIVFAQHSVATDGSFNDFHVIVARNTLGTFTKALQFRVHNLLFASLVRSGVLALGDKDAIEHTPHERCYQVLDAVHHLYRRIR